MSFMIVLQCLFNMRPIDFVFVLKGMTKGKIPSSGVSFSFNRSVCDCVRTLENTE